KQDKRRGLTRIALALALAGYCVAPVALAEDSAWVDSGETNIFLSFTPNLSSQKSHWVQYVPLRETGVLKTSISISPYSYPYPDAGR
ncbi:hypothetical protein ACVWDD_20555, partial [Escherichia coli]